MKILALDSASRSCGACVYDTVTGAYEQSYGDAESNHSVTLLSACRRVLDKSGLTVRDIDRLGITVGPGSFTGVKIGVAAVKGLAFPHHIPCCPVSTLHALADNVRNENGTVVALLDARRNAFYNALFSVKDGTVSRLCDDRQIGAEALCAELKGHVLLTGDGAPLFAKTCEAAGIPFTIVGPEDNAISPLAVARIAAVSDTVSAEKLAPVYLRPSQAERIRLGIQD